MGENVRSGIGRREVREGLLKKKIPRKGGGGDGQSKDSPESYLQQECTARRNRPAGGVCQKVAHTCSRRINNDQNILVFQKFSYTSWHSDYNVYIKL